MSPWHRFAGAWQFAKTQSQSGGINRPLLTRKGGDGGSMPLHRDYGWTTSCKRRPYILTLYACGSSLRTTNPTHVLINYPKFGALGMLYPSTQ